MPVPHQTFPASTLALAQERILVVDDEALIRETVALALTDEGYQVTAIDSGQQAVEMLFPAGGNALPVEIDLAIIDLMLPGVNGLDICRMIRHHQMNLPVLILSAKGSEMDRVVGLEVGADDYLPKPFGIRELIARCRALLRRQQWVNAKPADAVLAHQDIVLYLQEMRVIVAGQEVNLVSQGISDSRAVHWLLPIEVWSREELAAGGVGAMDFMGDRKTVDVHIRWLREKD
jgi:two-component system phosphate regulon response regulator PhoB